MSFSEWSNKKRKKEEEEESSKQSFSEWSNKKHGVGGENSTPVSEADSGTWFDSAAKDFVAKAQNGEIAPDRTWFQKSGLFDDGYQFGDVTKTILGSAADLAENVGAGIVGLGETAVDTLMGLAPYFAQGMYYQTGGGYNLEQDRHFDESIAASKEAASEFIKKDLYDEEEIAKTLAGYSPLGVTNKLLGVDSETDSVFGEKTDDLARSGGQMLATAGLQAVGIPWWLTTGASSYGGELENALNQDASLEEANLSAAISAGAEILTEQISGGISFGGSTLDDALTKELARGISNKTVRTLAKLGIDMAGEGTEEVLSGVMSAIGQKLTYADDKELAELFSSEEALESYIGGAVLGGGSGVIQAAQSNISGVDYVSGLTKNEQAVVDKVYNDRVAEAEKDGKVTNSQKSKIYDEVLEQMNKGYISTDTIEEVLGGETYKTYKDTVDSEDALQREYEELGETAQPTLKQQSRYAELEAKIKDIQENSSRSRLKDQLGREVSDMVKNDRLAESYNERSRKSQVFEADASQYSGAAKETVQNAVDSGILNNTNLTHDFVDMLAKLSEDKGVPFGFADNAKLKESGFALEGVTVNGFLTDSGVTVNVNSAKALNSVVGHEITHVLEGTEFYDTLQQAITEYAKSKGDYDTRLEALTKLYEGRNADVGQELVADLVGDYLFTDSDFVRKLSAEHRNVFQKLYDEIKYLYKIATAGSKEARQLEKVKKAFEDAYRESGKTQTDTKYSLGEIVDENQNSYGVGVHLDSTLLDNLTPKERLGMVKEYVKELGGESFTAFDPNGNAVDITIAKSGAKFKNQNGKRVPVNKDLTNKYIGNEVKQESIALIDELIVAAEFGGSKAPQYAHGWLDNNGQNDWEYWKTYIKDKNNTIWEATLNVANSTNGEKILYDISPIKKVGRSIELDALPTDNNIAQDGENVKRSLSGEGQQPKKYGSYNVYGKDIALEDIAPVREDIAQKPQAGAAEDIAPVGQHVDTTQNVVSEDELAPVREDALANSVQKTERNRYQLKDYSQHQKDNWQNSKRIVLYEGVEHFREFIRNALTGKTQTNKKMYFGAIPSDLAADIAQATGADVDGYNLSLSENEIRKIQKSHGREETETPRGQRAVTEADYLNIPNVVQSPDGISLSPKLYEGKPVIEFRKSDGNETSVVAAVVSDKRLDLFVQTTFVNKKTGSIATPKSVQADFFTPEAPGGTAPTISIPESGGNVNEDIAPVREDIAQPQKITAAPDDLAPVREDIAAVDAANSAEQRELGGAKPNEKERKWVGTSTESEAVDGKVLPADLDQELTHYQPISNKVTLGNANAMLVKDGYEKSVDYFNAQFRGNKIKLDDIALGERLIQEAVKKGDYQTAGELIQNVAILGTELGQKVQALSIIKRLSPEGQLQMLQKTVERGKTKGDKVFDGVEVTQDMVDTILKTYNDDGSYDQVELNKAVEDVKQQIADQMKVTKLEKVNAWRYLSMLGNPKTHIRNIVSNVAMKGTVVVKNALARTLEGGANATVKGAEWLVNKVTGKEHHFDTPIKDRTKTWKPATEDVKNFAKKKSIEMKDIISGDSKYSDSASIKEKRAIFKNKILNGLYEFNSDMLGREDWWFSKSAFKNTLSEYLTANGISSQADIKANSEIVDKGINYALEQSQISTFRQYSWAANKINEIERKNTATNIAVGAVLPFKKTPINIAKTGLNYSPLGFAKTLTYDISQVKKGNMEASELVDHLAQNVTGSALTLAGYMLASAGFLNGAGEDDKEGKYDYQLGEQAYSINIGDATFSLSWLSPVAMPLFVGANAYEQLVEGKEWNGDVVVQTLAQTINPLSEMSFLSSLDSVLSSYGSDIEKFTGIFETAAQSYVGQFVPTLSSQIAAVMDDTKRTTKAAADSGFKFFDETVNQLKYKIPFLRETLEPSTDIWGNEVKQTENVLTRAFETFLAPYAKRDSIATEVDKEIKDLYGETGDDGLIPSVPYNYVNYDGEKYKMSAEEFTDYKKTYGQTAFDMLADLFETDTYQNADSETRADMVNKVYDYARDEAKKEFFTGRGIDFANATLNGEEYYKENSIKGAIENDMSVGEYEFSVKYPGKYSVAKSVGGYDAFMTYSSELNNITADKDENGKTVSGSRKEKVIDYINSLDADYGEKIILFKSQYTSDDTYNYDIIDYLNSREDISYKEMETILKELGFNVDSQGNITWD